MKWILLISAMFWFAPAAQWGNDFEKAKDQASKEQKLILLNFSGSDWCGPCIRLKKEIFASDTFGLYAEARLVLVNADFPRAKKNQLPAAQQSHNDKLAEQYNTKGSFPMTLLLSADGRVIKSWEGYPNMDAEGFVSQLKQLDASRP